MKGLSISNIAWTEDNDREVYGLMKEFSFKGLEIAPTRIFKEAPYEKLKEAGEWSQRLKQDYGLCISSMQSIWYGRNEMLFGSEGEREVLLNYTRSAIDFAEAVGCGNLVFGCPRNRNIPDGADERIAVSFFRELGDYAASKNTVLAMEANPPVYNTNYINDTLSALELAEEVASPGFLLNLDIGTMIANSEDLSVLSGREGLINHVHISEPGLKVIGHRELHRELADFLRGCGYDKYVSIEMGRQEDISVIKEVMSYVSGLFDMA
jgi:sugar phosphate isomerase/epimerase